MRHSYGMTELPRHRLIQARKNAGYDTPSAAADANKRAINKNTLISHENGNRDISRKAAEKYGAVFGVEPGWILFGAGDEPTDLSEEWADWEARLREAGQLETAIALVRALIGAGSTDAPAPAGKPKAATKPRTAE